MYIFILWFGVLAQETAFLSAPLVLYNPWYPQSILTLEKALTLWSGFKTENKSYLKEIISYKHKSIC